MSVLQQLEGSQDFFDGANGYKMALERVNKKMNERIKIAIQKSGRLTEHSTTLLQKCGLIISHTKDQLIGYGENMPFDIMFVRDDDIPGLIQEKSCEIGIVGANVAIEKQLSYESSQLPSQFVLESSLDFGHCKLSLHTQRHQAFDRSMILKAKQ